MNIIPIDSILKLPKFMLMFTADTTQEAMQKSVWFELTDVFLYEAPHLKYKFYAVPLPDKGATRK